MKTCTVCRRLLLVEQFSAKGDRLRSQCKDCDKEYRAERAIRLQHSHPDEKPCSACKETLPADEFSTNNQAKTGLSAFCKKCQAEKDAERERYPRADPSLKKCCSVCEQTKTSDEFGTNSISKDGPLSWCRECSKWKRLTKKYRLTPAQYRDLAVNGCQICGSFEHLHVDHDHTCCPGDKSCGECIRGILCRTHNTGLGSFNDDPDLLIAAAEYLRGAI